MYDLLLSIIIVSTISHSYYESNFDYTLLSPSMSGGRDTLFTLPIGGNGKLVCFRPADKVYVLEFAAGTDNRLTTVRSKICSQHMACVREIVVLT